MNYFNDEKKFPQIHVQHLFPDVYQNKRKSSVRNSHLKLFNGVVFYKKIYNIYQKEFDVADSSSFLGLLGNIINQNETTYCATNNLARDQENGKVNHLIFEIISLFFGCILLMITI